MASADPKEPFFCLRNQPNNIRKKYSKLQANTNNDSSDKHPSHSFITWISFQVSTCVAHSCGRHHTYKFYKLFQLFVHKFKANYFIWCISYRFDVECTFRRDGVKFKFKVTCSRSGDRFHRRIDQQHFHRSRDEGSATLNGQSHTKVVQSPRL